MSTGKTLADPPRVMVKADTGSVFEAELIAKGEQYEIRRVDNGEQTRVEPTRVWLNDYGEIEDD